MGYTYAGDGGKTRKAVEKSNDSIKESNKILSEFRKFAETSARDNQKFIYLNTFIAVLILILTIINIFIVYNS